MPESHTSHSRQSLARRLRLQQLQIFETVASAGSILAASRQLAMTQPAVTKSIHELEQQVGGPLFTRGKRGVTLTGLGSLFLKHAQTVLAGLRYMAEDLNTWHTGAAGHVVVGTLISASASLLPEAIAKLRDTLPDVTITVQVGSNAMLFPELLRGALDVVVGVLPHETIGALPSQGESAQLLHVPLYRETLLVVTGHQNPLARKRTVQLADLHDLEWIVPTRESVAYPLAHEFFQREGLEMPSKLVESVSILTNVGLLTSRSMVGLMPQSAAERFANQGLLHIVPIKVPGRITDLGYTICAAREPSAATQHFLQALRQASKLLQR